METYTLYRYACVVSIHRYSNSEYCHAAGKAEKEGEVAAIEEAYAVHNKRAMVIKIQDAHIAG